MILVDSILFLPVRKSPRERQKESSSFLSIRVPVCSSELKISVGM
jgi:hypothetical protein